MKEWKEIYEFKDGNCAVYNGGEPMLKQLPDLITVMPKRFKEEVFKWLLDREYYRERKEVRRR